MASTVIPMYDVRNRMMINMSLNVHSASNDSLLYCVCTEEVCRVCDNFRLPITLSIDGKLLLFLSLMPGIQLPVS